MREAVAAAEAQQAVGFKGNGIVCLKVIHGSPKPKPGTLFPIMFASSEVRQPYSLAEQQLLEHLKEAGWKPDPTCSEAELCRALRSMEDLHGMLLESVGRIGPPLQATMRAGLEARLLSLLQLQEPPCRMLQPCDRPAVDPTAPVAPFYFFAPKLEGPTFSVAGTCRELGSASFDNFQSQPTAVFDQASQFLVGRILLPPPQQRGKWFEYKPCALWGGRFVADARPPMIVDAADRHQILDPSGIPFFNLDYSLATEWVLQLCGGLMALQLTELKYVVVPPLDKDHRVFSFSLPLYSQMLGSRGVARTCHENERGERGSCSLEGRKEARKERERRGEEHQERGRESC